MSRALIGAERAPRTNEPGPFVRKVAGPKGLVGRVTVAVDPTATPALIGIHG